jgi:hypothetical protein
MHFNRPRRFIFAAPNSSLSSRSAISVSPEWHDDNADPDRGVSGFIPELGH